MYISCYKPKDMEKMSFDDVTYVVGLIVNKTVIKPPKCKVDGEYVYIDEYSDYYQCEYCSRYGKLYVGDSLEDFSKWELFEYDKYFK